MKAMKCNSDESSCSERWSEAQPERAQRASRRASRRCAVGACCQQQRYDKMPAVHARGQAPTSPAAFVLRRDEEMPKGCRFLSRSEAPCGAACPPMLTAATSERDRRGRVATVPVERRHARNSSAYRQSREIRAGTARTRNVEEWWSCPQYVTA